MHQHPVVLPEAIYVSTCTVCPCGCVGLTHIVLVHVHVFLHLMSVTHLSPFCRQQLLQSLDKENAEGAL